MQVSSSRPSLWSCYKAMGHASASEHRPVDLLDGVDGTDRAALAADHGLVTAEVLSRRTLDTRIDLLGGWTCRLETWPDGAGLPRIGPHDVSNTVIGGYKRSERGTDGKAGHGQDDGRGTC